MKELVLSIPNSSGSSQLTIEPPKGVGTYSLSTIVQLFVTLLFVFAILLTLFFLISGGIDFIVSGGDKQKVVNARHKLTYAVVGLIIVLLSFFIINIVGGFFGVPLVRPPFSQPVCTDGNCITP